MESKVHILFLGTGTSSGVPVIGCDCPVCTSPDPRDHRFRSSLFVASRTTRLLIDTGPDLRGQLLRAKIDHIDAVLLTHYHKDHIAGFDDLRALIHRSNKPLPVYADDKTLDALHRIYPYAHFNQNTAQGLSIHTHTLTDNSRCRIGDIAVRAFRVWHGKLAILGFIFNEAIIYITDMKSMEAHTEQSLCHKKLLIVNAQQIQPHPTHMHLNETLAFRNRLQPQRTYLTHLSHHIGKASEQELPDTVSLAYDGLLITE